MAIRIGVWPDDPSARCTTPYSEHTPFDRMAREVLFMNNIVTRQSIVDRLPEDAGEKVPKVVPRKYDLDANIAEAQKMTSMQILGAVRPGGMWDYKREGHPELADLGNWNFGVVAKAWSKQYSPFSDVFEGFFEEMALRGAGAVQKATGTSKPEWGDADGDPPYGDDPVDQENIRNGWEADRLQESIPSSDNGPGEEQWEPGDLPMDDDI